MKALHLLLLPALIAAQCEDTMPSGKKCEAEDSFTEADPEACSWFFQCAQGCVERAQCAPDADGLPKVYDSDYDWCAYTEDVDCGPRPCTDEVACVTQPPRTTTSTTPDCGHIANCSALGEGLHPDPFNCRKYWRCYRGMEAGEHHMCPDDPATGRPEVFDLVYDGCNYQELTDCGERPICDECDENCEAPPTTTADCGHQMDCTDMEDGWYADSWNCRKYWHCLRGQGTHFLCDNNLQYNEKLVQCDWDDRVDCGDRPVCDECDADCHEDEEGGSQDPDCGPDDHHPPTICSGRPDGWYPDEFNCVKYWHCSGQTGQHFLCPTGLVYESTKIQCDYPDRVDCGDRPTCDSCDENCH